MKIDKVTLHNYRNLANIDIPLLPGTVIVGENRSGKSNLIHALRLIFDPALSNNDRQLTRNDFWDIAGDEVDPLAAGETIDISVEMTDFDDDPNIIAALGNALVKEDPLRARLTFRFAPIDTGDPNGTEPHIYRGRVYGGNDLESPIVGDWRTYLHSVFLHALRDVESDIKTWRRSPLRALLEAASKALSDADLSDVREAMKNANTQLNDLNVISELSQSINSRLVDMAGENQSTQTKLAAAPDDALRLIRTMRIYVDGEASRDLSSASLGTLNVLYLALLELGLASRLHESDISHVLVGIEEPEAHLHPHLQRLIFRRLLSQQQHSRTVIVTTQSPHIASVADPRSLVVLRTVEGQTRAAAAARAELDETEWKDIGRYLDATRAELVFARRVLLVEGYAEQVLMPSMAATLDMDLDKLGVTVCAINGTHFNSYVKLCNALEIPWAIITDGDPDANGASTGQARADKLIDDCKLNSTSSESGVFVGTDTFEYDLASIRDNIRTCFATLRELCAAPSREVIEAWQEQLPAKKDYMTIIENAGGKGRFAQRLSTEVITPPTYIVNALRYLEPL